MDFAFARTPARTKFTHTHANMYFTFASQIFSPLPLPPFFFCVCAHSLIAVFHIDSPINNLIISNRPTMGTPDSFFFLGCAEIQTTGNRRYLSNTRRT